LGTELIVTYGKGGKREYSCCAGFRLPDAWDACLFQPDGGIAYYGSGRVDDFALDDP
jgi:hypothetical protein